MISLLLSFAIGIIVLTGTQPLTQLVTRHLETQYSILQQPPNNTSTIVVLSGGYNGMRAPSANNNLNTITLCRTIEGIRLTKAIEQQHRPAQLILSGSKDTGTIMRNTAVMLGIPQNQTTVAPPALDTYHQALSLKKQLANTPFILVTSATHMARAMALFKKANLHPMAAPSCFTYRTTRSPSALNYIPTANTTALFNLSWHEYLGLLWGKIRGIT